MVRIKIHMSILIMTLNLLQITQSFRFLQTTIDPETNVCLGTEGSRYRPFARAFYINSEVSSKVYNLWVSKTEDKLYTVTHHQTFGDGPKGFQLSKRSMDLSPDYERSYNLQIDLRGSTMDANQTMVYIVTNDSEVNYVASFNSTTGSSVIIREIVDINSANSIAVTDTHVYIATKIVPGGQTGILVMSRVDLSIIQQIGLSAYHFVSVHQMEGLNSQVLMIVHSVSEISRRNLIDATNGGRVGFQLADSSGPSTMQQLACGSGDCSYSSNSRAIRRFSGEILTSVRVDSGTLLLIEFSSNMKYNSVYDWSFTSTHSYMNSLVEFPEVNLIYALIGSNPPLDTPSTGPMLVVFNADSKQVVERWQTDFTRQIVNVIDQKAGFVYFGGHDLEVLGLLYKTIPSSFSLLEDKVSFESMSRDGIALHDRSRYTVSEVVLETTGLANAATGSSIPSPLSFTYNEETEPFESFNSTFVWTGELFFNISVVSSTNTSHNFGLPCSSANQAWTYDVHIESSDKTWVSVEDRKLQIQAPVINVQQRYNVTIRVFSESDFFIHYAQVNVEPCGVKNCQTCSTASAVVCETCQAGFNLQEGECNDQANPISLSTPKALGTTMSIKSLEA